MADTRVTEDHVQYAILRLLNGGQIWTNAGIKRELRKVLPLSAADKATANFRPNEEKWEEQVNNALSPSRGRSLTATQCVETVERGHHRITEAGREELKRREAYTAAFDAAMDSPEGRELFRAISEYFNSHPN